jgi:hypothetical protein
VPRHSYLNFDAANDGDYVEINDAPTLDLTTGVFTISAWIMPTSWGQNNQGRVLDHGGGSGGNAGWSLHLENKSSRGFPQALRMQINNDSSFDGMSDPTAIALNAWQHVAVTFDNGTLTFFVDGLNRGMRTGVPAPIARNGPIFIGARGKARRNFDGAIDEVRIWSRALTQQEIQNNMDLVLTGSELGLVAYYRFDEGSGQFAFDATGNGHDGRLGSTTGIDSHDPLWTATPTATPAAN